MRRIPFILLMLTCTCAFSLQGCGESDCSLTTISYAHFDFLDSKTYSPVGFTQGVTVTGTAQYEDSTMTDTLFNLAESSMSLPLSFTNQTTYVMHYSETMRDTIEITHKNIPFVSDIECGTMMHYFVESYRYTTNALDSVVLINPEITNEERKNFNIYYRASDSE